MPYQPDKAEEPGGKRDPERCARYHREKFGTVLAVQTEDKKMLAGSDASQASVTGKIVEQGRAKKLTVLKYKKTNQYKIQRGHRQNYTAVQVSEIKL